MKYYAIFERTSRKYVNYAHLATVLPNANIYNSLSFTNNELLYYSQVHPSKVKLNVWNLGKLKQDTLPNCLKTWQHNLLVQNPTIKLSDTERIIKNAKFVIREYRLAMTSESEIKG